MLGSRVPFSPPHWRPAGRSAVGDSLPGRLITFAPPSRVSDSPVIDMEIVAVDGTVLYENRRRVPGDLGDLGDLAAIGPEGRLPLRGHLLPGAYAVILPLAESDEIMREGPARRKTFFSMSEPGNSIGF